MRFDVNHPQSLAAFRAKKLEVRFTCASHEPYGTRRTAGGNSTAPADVACPAEAFLVSKFVVAASDEPVTVHNGVTYPGWVDMYDNDGVSHHFDNPHRPQDNLRRHWGIVEFVPKGAAVTA